MPTETQAEIHVPAFMDGPRIIVPQISLGRDIEYRTDEKRNTLSAVRYQDFKPATLAELRHAYFDKDEKGVFVSPDYRQSVLSARGRGEWTSTFLRDGKESAERPERVIYDGGIWMAEGGKVTPVELPGDGWTLEYDKPTGFPSRTSSNRNDAHKIFGDDTSYFYATRNGLRAVLRNFNLGGDGPFSVDAGFEPDGRNSDVGSRSCGRSEQDAQRLATSHVVSADDQPVYVMGQTEYDVLTRVAKDNTEVADILPRITIKK